jgi:hypothetical protein
MMQFFLSSIIKTLHKSQLRLLSRNFKLIRTKNTI